MPGSINTCAAQWCDRSSFQTGDFKMDIATITNQIDHEISTRTSDGFGIKVGGDLYNALVKAGKIKKATFSALGTGAFSKELPAYNGKYFVFSDWELDDWGFEVGVPSTRP
jgi:hypothetical protein